MMMSVYATSGGGIGVAYANTTFRTLGLLQFQDTAQLADLEGVVVQARVVSSPSFKAHKETSRKGEISKVPTAIGSTLINTPDFSYYIRWARGNAYSKTMDHSRNKWRKS